MKTLNQFMLEHGESRTRMKGLAELREEIMREWEAKNDR